MIRAFANLQARAAEYNARRWREHPYQMFTFFVLAFAYRMALREYKKNPRFQAQVDARIAQIKEKLNG